jgi:hypothetical protein
VRAAQLLVGLVTVVCLAGCGGKPAPAANSSAAAAASGPQWHCLAKSITGHGLCLPDAMRCEVARREAASTEPCATQSYAWCFMRPESAVRSRYTGCAPTGSDCGYARAVYIERFDRPPRRCRRYGGPTAAGAPELVGAAPPDDKMPTTTEFEERCNAGDADACFIVAARFEQGDDVKRDLKQCIKYERRACELGSQAGCVALAKYMVTGRGVPRDPEKAFAVFERECAADFARGCESLGQAYEHGWGTEQNFREALAAYRKSCRLDPELGCRALRDVSADK